MGTIETSSDGSGPARPVEPVPAGSAGEWLAAGLTVGLAALFADAAVETVRSGSPVRWWVAGGLAVYAIATASLWRRTSWRTKAALSCFALLATLAGTAWLPGGLTEGIRLAGRAPSTVLEAVAAVGVALAGLTLWRTERLPLGVRIAAIALAGYGVAGFIDGIVAGTPFRALLAGASLWRRLPMVLQGAFVGGVVVVPVGLVVQTVRLGIRRMRQHEPSSWGWRRALGLALTFAIILAAMPAFDRASGQVAAARPSLALPPAAQLEPATTLTMPQMPPAAPDVQPAELVARADAVAMDVPRIEYDVTARADTLGPGLAPAFSYVRDHIRYEPYSGVFRGADGAYQAGAANALDRSLLLALLLKRHGIPTRFAQGRLAKKEVDRLWERIFEAPAQKEATGAEPGPPAAPAATGAPGAPGATGGMKERLFERARRDYAVIRGALGAGVPAAADISQEQVFSEIEAHVWLQARVNDDWVDLDTSFPDAEPGRAFCAADRTVAEIPADLHQRVTMRVSVETLEANALKRSVVLETTMPADELLDRQIFLVHTPAGLGGGVAAAVTGTFDVWTPRLWVDGDVTTTGKSISFGDTAAPSTASSPADSSSPAGAPGSVLDALSPDGSRKTSGPVFVAEWLEFDIALPNGRHEATRRVVTDRAGSAWRRGSAHDASRLRPLGRNKEGLAAPQTAYNIWFSGGRHDVAGYADAVKLLARAVTPVTGNTPAQTAGAAPAVAPSDGQGAAASTGGGGSFGEQVWPLVIHDFAWQVWTDNVIVPALNDSSSYRLYADSPRISIFSVGPDVLAGGFVFESDLRRDHLRGLSRDGTAAAAVTERKIWFGALEGALEHEMLAADRTAASDPPVLSTSSLLDATGAVVVRASDTGNLASLTSNEETASRINVALASGATLVVPRIALRGDHAGWWEVASAGDTRAVLDDDLNAGRLGSGGGSTGIGTPGGGGRTGVNGVDPGTYNGSSGSRGNRLGAQSGRPGSEYSLLITVMVVMVGAVVVWLIYKAITAALNSVVESVKK